MHRLSLLVLIFTGFAFAQDSATDKGDWPQWRGPNRDAICTETGLLKSWPDDGPPLLWKHTGLGGGYSTPSFSHGKVYGMSYRGNDEVVWCLDESTRKELWATKIATKIRIDRGEGSRCTPTLDGDRLYAVGVAGDIVCLNSATGNVVWKKNFAKDFKGKMMSGWGFSESPLIDGDALICTPGGEEAAVVSLHKITGAMNWQADVPGSGGAGYASLMPAEVGGIRMYITWLGRKLVGVAAKDGKLLWEYSKCANNIANIPTVLIRGNDVFCSTSYGAGSAVLKLSPSGDGVKAEEVQFISGRMAQNHHGGMVLVGDHVYFGHGQNKGIPVCIEFATGKLAWTKDRGFPGSGSAAVLAFGNHLIFRWDDGTIGLLEANPAEYKLISSFKQPNRSSAKAWSHPVIVNGKMYIRDQDLLLCYDVKAK